MIDQSNCGEPSGDFGPDNMYVRDPLFIYVDAIALDVLYQPLLKFSVFRARKCTQKHKI